MATAKAQNNLRNLLRRLEQALPKMDSAFVTAISERHHSLLSEIQLLIREVAVLALTAEKRDPSSGEEG